MIITDIPLPTFCKMQNISRETDWQLALLAFSRNISKFADILLQWDISFERSSTFFLENISFFVNIIDFKVERMDGIPDGILQDCRLTYF